MSIKEGAMIVYGTHGLPYTPDAVIWPDVTAVPYPTGNRVTAAGAGRCATVLHPDPEAIHILPLTHTLLYFSIAEK